MLFSITGIKLLTIFVLVMVGTFTERKTSIMVDVQDRKLQLNKVKTGNAGLLCYMASKLDIDILLKKDEIS